jgi:hypothetical protein
MELVIRMTKSRRVRHTEPMACMREKGIQSYEETSTLWRLHVDSCYSTLHVVPHSFVFPMLYEPTCNFVCLFAGQLVKVVSTKYSSSSTVGVVSDMTLEV